MWSRGFVICICVGFLASEAMAQSTLDVSKVVASTYLREQIKEQARHFLDKNPGIVGSTNPQFGTQSIRLVSQMMAAYNFVTAKTDKQRGYAALQFVVPDPSTALAIFAIQLGDSLLSLHSERKVAEIQLQTMELLRSASEKLSRVALAEVSIQQGYILNFSELVEQIATLSKSLDENRLFLKLSQNSDLPVEPIDIESAMQLAFQLDETISQLAASFEYVKKGVQLESFGISAETITEWQTFVDTEMGWREQFMETKSSFKNIFVLASVQADTAAFNGALEDHRFLFKAYVQCVKVMLSKDIDFSMRLRCQAKFGFTR